MIIIPTKFSDFCTSLYPYKAGINSKQKFVEEMLKSISKNISYSDSQYKNLFSGRRALDVDEKPEWYRNLNLSTIMEFFDMHIDRNKKDAIFATFGISKNSRHWFTYFCRACAEYLKLIVKYDDDQFDNTVNELYLDRMESGYNYQNTISISDSFYVLDARKKCPLSRHLLINPENGTHIANYKIVKIYPNNLPNEKKILFDTVIEEPENENDPDNLIALCPICAEKYESAHDFNTFKILVTAKNAAKKRQRDETLLADYDLQEGIKDVISFLLDLPKSGNDNEKLSLNALKIKAKIPEDDICYDDVKNRVVRFYNYIDAFLVENEENTAGGSTKLGEEIKAMSTELVENGLTPSEAVDRLANEINGRYGGDSQTLKASEYIVAYFVQHCEVLSK